MSEELLDVIDENNTVIDTISYSLVHSQHKRHRVVHVFIKNKAGKLLLQKRSATVKAFSLCWTFSAGGHVRSGENFEDAIRREADEELGIKLFVLELAVEGFYDGPDDHHVYFQTYTTQYDGEFHPNEDVTEVRWVDIKDIEKMQSQGEKFHNEFLYVLEEFLQKTYEFRK